MAPKKTPEVPDSWGNERHREIEGFGLGTGFALFEEPAESLRGILRTFFPTKHGPAVSIEQAHPWLAREKSPKCQPAFR